MKRLASLFQVESHSIEELYLTIENRLSGMLLEEKLDELNSILGSLGRVKKNNREMAKLVSSLGVKSQ